MLCPAAEPRSEWGVFSAGLSREEWSLCLLVPLPSGYTVLVSHSAHQNPPPLWKKDSGPFPPSCFPDRLQQVPVHGAIAPQVHNYAFTLLNFFLFPSAHLSNPTCQVPLNISLVFQHISFCPQICLILLSYFERSQFWFLRDITCNQVPAGVSITITLWSQWESQFLTHLHSNAHLLSSYLTNLALRLHWGNMSKALCTTSTLFSLFTDLGISTGMVSYDFSLKVDIKDKPSSLYSWSIYINFLRTIYIPNEQTLETAVSEARCQIWLKRLGDKQTIYLFFDSFLQWNTTYFLDRHFYSLCS